MNSNGIRLAEDLDAVPRSWPSWASTSSSRFNTFDPGDEPAAARPRPGGGQAARDREPRAGPACKMTLLNVLIRGVNEDALAGHPRTSCAERPHPEPDGADDDLHGAGRRAVRRGRSHIPVDEAARIVCEQSGGRA